MRALLLAGASAFVLTLTTAPDASANPKNKFSDGGTATVDIMRGDSQLNVEAPLGNVEISTLEKNESDNFDVEVISGVELNLQISQVTVNSGGSANGGSISTSAGGCSGGGGSGNLGFGIAVGCLPILGPVSDADNTGSTGGGNASSRTGDIIFGNNTFQNTTGFFPLAMATGNGSMATSFNSVPIYVDFP